MKNNLESIIEGILFVAGESVEKALILEKLEITSKELEKAVELLRKKYTNSGIRIMEFKEKLQLATNSEYADDIALVLNPIRERQLSKATMETIAIVAYKQPITRLEIESIRGVNSDYALQTLIKHNLIEVVGRKDVVGRPLLFGTTEDFLKRFELNDINDLPNYDDLILQIKEINESSQGLYKEYEVPTDEITHNGLDLTEEEKNMLEQIESEDLLLKDDTIIC